MDNDWINEVVDPTLSYFKALDLLRHGSIKQRNMAIFALKCEWAFGKKAFEIENITIGKHVVTAHAKKMGVGHLLLVCHFSNIGLNRSIGMIGEVSANERKDLLELIEGRE